MREIKFRAWDTEKRKMYHQTSSEWYLDNEYDSLTFPFETGVWGHADTYTLMQYTGLKDKNGKEIYEGDIVGYWSVGFVGEVQYHSSPRTEFFIWGKDENHDLYLTADLEVIGNIYENPELLESLRKVRGR